MAKAAKRQGPRVRRSQDAASAKKTADKQPKKGFIRRFAGKVASARIFKPVRWVFGYIRRGLRFITPRYFVNAWKEVKKVTWPNRRETWRLTAAVFVFSIVFGVLVAIVDKGLDEVFKNFVLKK